MKINEIKNNVSFFTFVLSIISMLIVGCQETTENDSITPSLPSSIEMKSIPGGTFIMGDNSIYSPRKNITASEHEVTVSSFEISETEVTTAQFAEFLSNAYNDGLVEINETDRTTEVICKRSPYRF